jgi:ComF family protein
MRITFFTLKRDFRFHLSNKLSPLRIVIWVKEFLFSLLSDFLCLFFPRICAGCGSILLKNEEMICIYCEYHLPHTNFHLSLDNPVHSLFCGKVTLASAAAYLYFNKGSKVQHLIHELKYKGRKDIGIWLGKQYGNELKNSSYFNAVQLIIPIPLHDKRLKQRGYNQSEQFAIGMGASMSIPVASDALYRNKETATQTKKSRFHRWQNVADVFTVRNPAGLEMKHILLVDDVITTGATLESCIGTLSSIKGIRISVATIAVAPI